MTLLEINEPKEFSEIVEQEHVVYVLKRLLKEPEKNPKSWLFYGPYGTGKSSSVKVFYNELSKKEKVLYYEYDSTKLNKNSIKDLCNLISNSLSFSKNKIIFCFEEVQGIIRKDSQDSFLKILEKKYENIYYFFTTTELEKIVEPVKSRLIELRFHAISDEAIKKHLTKIAKDNNIIIDDKVLNNIIIHSDGHLRDAIKMLDLYTLSDNYFDKLISNTISIIKSYLFGEIDLKAFKPYSVDVLSRDLNIVVQNYVKENIGNFIKTSKFLELYLKYKNFISSIEDFNSVILILKKFLSQG